MPAGHCAQICIALSALLTPALCAAVDDPASRPATEPPFIGLLLPFNAPEFSRTAEAVRLGCQAALAHTDKRPPLQVVRTDAQASSIISEYEAAVQRGAAVMVGPLTRSGVTALATAGHITVVTLALNVADGDQPLPPRLYTFGLSAENEARAVARTAFAQAARECGPCHRAGLVLGGEPEGVEAGRQRLIAVSDVESERDDRDVPGGGEGGDAGTRERPHHHGGSALHRGFVLGDDARGLRVGPDHLQGWALFGVGQRGLTTQPDGLGGPRELRRVERKEQADEGPFGRGPA